MIDDLDRTLKNLLEDPDCGLPELDPSPAITFGAPDSKFAPTPPAINLFLYDVRENRELRSNEVVVELYRGRKGVSLAVTAESRLLVPGHGVGRRRRP